MIYGHYTNPCPDLRWDGSRYVCSLYLRDPERYERFLGIADGCHMPLNPWRQSVTKRT